MFITPSIQIGIEAKLALNAKVISQVLEPDTYWHAAETGPDYRAVLVPAYASGGLEGICRRLDVTVIRMGDRSRFDPYLPSESYSHERWRDQCPWSRVTLPEFVPDCEAGTPAPTRLTPWKIKAIRIAVLLKRRGYVTRADFTAIQIDHRRWIDGRWVVWDLPRRVLVAGDYLPRFERQHPRNFEEIAASFDKWAPPEIAPPAVQGSLL